MVARLAILLLVLAAVISVGLIMIFWYFNQKDERRHEKDMEQLERDKELFSNEYDSIDRQLDQEKKR